MVERINCKAELARTSGDRAASHRDSTGKCRAGTDRPAPTQAEAGDTATQGRPSPITRTIVDLRLSAALAAQVRSGQVCYSAEV
jgi:hypothetical protein